MGFQEGLDYVQEGWQKILHITNSDKNIIKKKKQVPIGTLTADIMWSILSFIVCPQCHWSYQWQFWEQERPMTYYINRELARTFLVRYIVWYMEMEKDG